MSILFTNILVPREWTQSADNLFHSFMVLSENEYFPTSNLLYPFTRVKSCPLALNSELIFVYEYESIGTLTIIDVGDGDMPNIIYSRKVNPPPRILPFGCAAASVARPDGTRLAVHYIHCVTTFSSATLSSSHVKRRVHQLRRRYNKTISTTIESMINLLRLSSR